MEYIVNDIPLRSEEDVKIKIVNPFLESLGFDKSELFYEQSFEIQIGRKKEPIEIKKQIEKRFPRLDILVKRGESNLFVVEVKSDKTPITPKEIEQATSYARLVQPIAPFTIITNGKEFSLYNSIDQKKIKIDDFKIQDEYSVTLPEDLIHRALKHFIGYSERNFQVYFNNQLEHNMKTLKGSKKELSKKYIPELHVEREELHKKLIEFGESDKKVFSILGDSGSGKTSSMCYQAENFVKNNIPVIFYESFDLEEDILKTISQDINLEFSQQTNETQIIKQLSSMFSNQSIFIFIDAIDEWPVSNGSKLINRFVNLISTQDNIKVVFSCKSNTWSQYVSHNGIPTRIIESIYECSSKGGYFLPALTDLEFSKLLRKYRLIYSFNGKINRDLLFECKKNPFLLKIIFTIALKNNSISFSALYIDLFKAYLESIFELGTRANRDYVYQVLLNTAKLAYEKDNFSIDLNELKKLLKLRPSEELPEFLFSNNILERYDNNFQTQIKFYFDKLRDYLIAYHVEKWNESDTQMFLDDFKSLNVGGVREQAISFFLPYANTTLKKACVGEIYKNAEEYLNYYKEVIDKNFSLLKIWLSPYTGGDIGFIALIDITKLQLFFYGFKPIEPDDKQIVQFIPFFGPSDNVDKLYDYGAIDIHWTASSGNFQDIDVKKEIIENEIIKQIEKLISSGKLNESHNINLLLEKSIAIYYKASSQSWSNSDVNSFCHSILNEPCSLTKIERLLKYKKGLNYYRSELIEQRVKEGRFKRTVSGTRTHTSTPFASEDISIIEEKAKRASTDKKIAFPRSGYRELEEMSELFNDIKMYLKHKGIDKIENSICLNYEQAETPEFLIKLYEQFLSEYKIIVETNFPTLKQYFSLYSMMPLKLYIVTDIIPDLGMGLKLCFVANEGLSNNIVCYLDDKKVKINYGKLILETSSEQIKINSMSQCTLNSKLHPHENFLHFNVPHNFCIIRSMVYSTIKREFSEVKKQFANHYEMI